MESTAFVLQCMLVLLVMKHIDSATSLCECKFPHSFCPNGITALQGKVLAAQIEQSVSGKGNAQEILYQIDLRKRILEGSRPVAMARNIFTISYPQQDVCELDIKRNIGKELVFVGHVDLKGQFGKPVCYWPLKSRGEDNYEVFSTADTIKALCKAMSLS